MRIFSIRGSGVMETDALPDRLPEQGYLWIACGRREFEAAQAPIQAALQAFTGTALVDLHISDLLNSQLPSHHDYTSQYDLLVFRRLATGPADADTPPNHGAAGQSARRGGPPILRRIDTSPVSCVVFDRVLLTVHPDDCRERDAYAARLVGTEAGSGGPDARSTGARGVPASPADMMLRLINHMVDGYLALRRELTRQLDHWQQELLDPRTRFSNWSTLLDARLALHQLDQICEEQRAAMQDWIESIKGWPEPAGAEGRRELELLLVRSRDVLEHIERVVHHVSRLEHNAETAVQMHFSAQSNRTNDIMRTLTALTAIFLPLNLITGFFGMNFEFMPLIHHQAAFWWTLAIMVLIAAVTGLVFWRKRYLARTGR